MNKEYKDKLFEIIKEMIVIWKTSHPGGVLSTKIGEKIIKDLGYETED